MSLEAVQDKPAEEPVQLEFLGMPVQGFYFTLRTGGALLTGEQIDYGQHVEFSGNGRVCGFNLVEKGGKPVLVHVVEVLEAELL